MKKKLNPIKLEKSGLLRNKDGTVKSGVLNPLGRPKRKTITELIHERLDKDPKGWDDLITTLLTFVKSKDKEMIKELWRYTDGMPKQSTEISTAEGKPLILMTYGHRPTDKSSTKTETSS